MQHRKCYAASYGAGLLCSSTASMAHCSDLCRDSSWLDVSLSMNRVTNWPNTLESWYSWERETQRERDGDTQKGRLKPATVKQKRQESKSISETGQNTHSDGNKEDLITANNCANWFSENIHYSVLYVALQGEEVKKKNFNRRQLWPESPNRNLIMHSRRGFIHTMC